MQTLCVKGGGASHVLGAHITSDIHFIECFFFPSFFVLCMYFMAWEGGVGGLCLGTW